MATEQDVTLAGLETAIKMEIDGKGYYLKASETSKNELGKKLLKQLASEEDIHRKVFEGIFKNISEHQGWPPSKIDPEGVKRLETVFSKAIKGMAKNVATISSEMKAVQTAMDMENKTYDFYKQRSGQAVYSGEKELYEAIAAQEKGHHRLLLDYFEFLKDPAAYFVEKEHQSVDGG